MKVILLQDVPRVGQRFAVKEVPDGHALNKLIPKGLAEPATPENLKRAKARVTKAEVERVAIDAAFVEALDALSNRTLTLEVEANRQGHLFKAINADDVVAAAKEEGIILNPSQIVIENPIKEVGEHIIAARSGEQGGTIELEIVANK